MFAGWRIRNAAADWEGTPYISEPPFSKGPRGGVDCLHFIGLSVKEVGIISEVPQESYDRKFWMRKKDLIRQGIERGLADLHPDFSSMWLPHDTELIPGDILLFKTLPNLDQPNHVGLVDIIDRPQTWILHADSVDSRGVVSMPLPPKWAISDVVRILP